MESFSTNNSHDSGVKSLEYWIKKLQHKIEHLQRFTKNVILEGILIIVKYNYFYINYSFFYPSDRKNCCKWVKMQQLYLGTLHMVI